MRKESKHERSERKEEPVPVALTATPRPTLPPGPSRTPCASPRSAASVGPRVLWWSSKARA